MNTLAGVIAGFAVIGGAAALYRLSRRKAEGIRRAIDELRGVAEDRDTVLDFERDPVTGAWRARG